MASTFNEEWANFTTTVNKAATEHLGQRRSKQHEWITTESIEDLIAKRKAIKPALSNEYQELNRQKQT